MTETIIVYATSNPGKVEEMKRHLGNLGFDVKSLKDMGCADRDVPETGTSLGENAFIKVNAYAEELQARDDLAGKRVIILSDDTGLEISGLGGEPGIHVRRWRDHETRMEDEEIIDYAFERMAGLTGDDRAAQFRCVLAVGMVQENGKISEPLQFEGTLAGHVLERENPDVKRMEGFPFASLLFIDEWNMLLGQAEQLPDGEKEKYLSHRERAVLKSIPFLKKMASA
ncbi:MAG TPA: non-canonical purine NTP pyrophosphatase [Candidatus Paceibacterota bacterium]|jgi:XTP/dITP diphosphohydrolase|nr:non-canonical purine NTP pyrophosphatase [Candidatus Paceibacterota bacterium]